MRGDYARHYARGHFIMRTIMHVVIRGRCKATPGSGYYARRKAWRFFYARDYARDYARCLSEVNVHR